MPEKVQDRVGLWGLYDLSLSLKQLVTDNQLCKLEMLAYNIGNIDIYINNKSTMTVTIFSENSLVVHPTLSSLSSFWKFLERITHFSRAEVKGLGGIGFWGELWFSHTILCSTCLPLVNSSPVLCNCLMATSCTLCFLTKVIPNTVNPRTPFPRMCLVAGRETFSL